MTKQTITIPDGYAGHTVTVYAKPIKRDGDLVKLRCAEPGKEWMIKWAYAWEKWPRVTR